ncbi:MAG: serine/threonine protein kinase, partial [Ktedonobacteraceae bacterium]|nr:serine/threonine protein kinase [Ktedonobacteraceae bacterium]
LYLIHRDVKPENMLVGANGGILLTDFGIATVAQNSYTLSKQHDGIGGTAAYMAPEQIDGRPQTASDQYALAVLTYEWLSGKRLFQGTALEVMMQHMAAPPPSLSRQVPMLTTEVEHVIFTALAKDPKQRFNTIQAFATALTQASRQSFPLSLPPSPPSSPPLHSTETMAEAIPFTSNVPFSNRQAPYAPYTPSSTPERHLAEPQPPPHKGPSWGMIILLVTLVLLISGIGTFVYIASDTNNFKTYLAASPPKVTPTIAATPTIPDAHTDPAGFYTWITSRQPANAQSFTDPMLGWDTSTDCSLVNGKYQVSAQPTQGAVILNSCLAEKTNYVDFVFQVDMTVTNSETAGLIFHRNPVLNAQYLFPVNSDSTYLLTTSNLSYSSQNTLVPSGSFSKHTPNRLTVVARSHDISLFINGHYLTTTSDATASSGQIGLFVEAKPTDQGIATAEFSNLKIWALS